MYHSTLDFQDASTLHNFVCYHSVYNVSIFSFLLFWTPRIVFYFVFYFTSVLSNSAGYVPRTLYGTVSMCPWLCAWGTIGYIYIFPALYGIVGIRPWIWGNGQIVGSVCPQRSIRSGKNSRGSALCWDLFFRVHLCAFGPMYSSGCLLWFFKRKRSSVVWPIMSANALAPFWLQHQMFTQFYSLDWSLCLTCFKFST